MVVAAVNTQKRRFLLLAVHALFVLTWFSPCECLFLPSRISRREWLVATSTATTSSFVVATFTSPAVALSDDDSITTPRFQTAAYSRREYTNSITASRDTNVSPAEAYDMIRQYIPSVINNNNNNNTPRALDLGAGAGVSTAVLWQMGYTTLDAVDWSRTAWDQNVVQPIPPSIQFWEMSDDDFFDAILSKTTTKTHAANNGEQQPNNNNNNNDSNISTNNTMHQPYDAIVYNFAVNFDKAVAVAQGYLKPDTGRLLAPCNDKRDYWFKQSYVVLDSTGKVLYQSPPEVGAWSVQFQPDVTAQTCTSSIWCANQNGFVPMNKK